MLTLNMLSEIILPCEAFTVMAVAGENRAK